MAQDEQEFQRQVLQARIDGDTYIEVEQFVFDYYMRGKTQGKFAYFTYGQPGVRVYLKGTREEIENHENRALI